MWRSMIVAALLAFVDCAAGCGDDNAPPPTCASLGCGTVALCNRQGQCTCDGRACVQETPDAGVSP
jgi:hypothetical protein